MFSIITESWLGILEDPVSNEGDSHNQIAATHRSDSRPQNSQVHHNSTSLDEAENQNSFVSSGDLSLIFPRVCFVVP
jgi:hypothetical protein